MFIIFQLTSNIIYQGNDTTTQSREYLICNYNFHNIIIKELIFNLLPIHIKYETLKLTQITTNQRYTLSSYGAKPDDIPASGNGCCPLIESVFLLLSSSWSVFPVETADGVLLCFDLVTRDNISFSFRTT